jgi:secreted PhoX family phosphatase
MGRFKHEAAAADPVRKVIYLTEDETDGKFYRFVPATWGDLSSGTLQVLRAGSGTSGSYTWATVPDPDGSPTVTRRQVSGAKSFDGGEGCHYAADTVWFTTKGDNRIWQVNLLDETYQLGYDDALVSGAAPLTGVDNITGAPAGDLYVAEDGGTMDICLITPDEQVSVFLRVTGHSGSEITGPAFTPAGNRLYFSSQRGTSGSSSGGITYCVTGPFRT